MQINITQAELRSLSQNSDILSVTEHEAINLLARNILANKHRLSYNAILISLVNELESTLDQERLDLLRNCLAWVIQQIPDDEG